ncbi:MAG: pyrimidine-nucleoside phosphorylase [Clostridia bacterium]|nr:pyrimidine-nucleoside phosphorylase [Clostridia bacterium]
MTMYDIIDKKRHGKALNKEEIEYFVHGYVDEKIPDYQMASLLMAICCNGMEMEELTNLTIAMANSGDKFDLSPVNGVTVDKHSTGGVGDKTTLIVGPIVASLGCKVAKMSGRGLGFTGGTIDKLESIEGYNVIIPENDFINQVNRIGIGLISSSGNLAPADKKIYALRDVTATVESIPLIASSIMSKKIASGSKCILLDVKMGSGAFMQDLENATQLAEKMVNIGKLANRNTMAIITNMDMPLGLKIGNNLEVQESIDVLKGKGPEDLTNLCVELASCMLMLCTNKNKEECISLVKKSIEDGTAYSKFRELVIAQGGNVNVIDNPELFKKSKYIIEVKANKTGYIYKMNTSSIGRISCILGAGRERKEDIIDYSAGIELLKKTGDFIKEGDIIAKLHTSNNKIMEEAEKLYLNSIEISNEEPEKKPMVYKIIK